MDVRQLQYFISVADHLNFTKAAEHHFISQTAMSQQIMSLENNLGVKLFIRENRTVRLTTAGRVFYKEARFIVSQVEEAIAKTRKADSGIEATLKIGFLGTNEKVFLPNLIRKFRQQYPSIDLTLYQNNIGELHEAIDHGILDIVFTTTYGLDLLPGIVIKKLINDPWCAILPSNHPLANRSKILRSSLINEPFISLERSVAPSAYDAWLQCFVKHGFTPKIVASCRTLEALLIMVEAEMGIAVFRRSLENYSYNDLRFINLDGKNEYSEIVIIWKSDNPNPSIPLFYESLQDQLNSSR